MTDITSIKVGDRVPTQTGYLVVTSVDKLPAGGVTLTLTAEEETIIGDLNADIRKALLGVSVSPDKPHQIRGDV